LDLFVLPLLENRKFVFNKYLTLRANSPRVHFPDVAPQLHGQAPGQVMTQKPIKIHHAR
jgi:hypothetical protein